MPTRGGGHLDTPCSTRADVHGRNQIPTETRPPKPVCDWMIGSRGAARQGEKLGCAKREQITHLQLLTVIAGFSKAVQKRVKKVCKRCWLASNVENLGKLSVEKMKNDHGLVSIFIAKPLSKQFESREPQSGKQTEQDQ